jgi:hypothetical protein
VAGALADVRREVAAGAAADQVLGLIDELLHRVGAAASRRSRSTSSTR